MEKYRISLSVTVLMIVIVAILISSLAYLWQNSRRISRLPGKQLSTSQEAPKTSEPAVNNTSSSLFQTIITAPRAISGVNCDTDGGVNIYEAGTVTTMKKGTTTTLTDICVNEKQLYEQYCISSETGGGTVTTNCLGSCEFGACTRTFDSAKCKSFAPLSNRAEEDTINLVIVGAGYSNLDEFIPWVKAEFAPNFFSVEPWESNQDAFNFYYIDEVASFDKQGNFSLINTLSLVEHCQKPNKAMVIFINGDFDPEATYPPTERDLYSVLGTTFVAGRNILEYTDSKGNFYPTHFATNSRIILHELGHSIGGLKDEYYTTAVAYSKISIPAQTNLEPNCFSSGIPTTVEQCRAEASWKDLISLFPEEVNCFEGCYYKNENIYRPTKEGIMRLHDNERYGLAEERSICCKILQRTGSVEGYCNLFNQEPLDLVEYCKKES